MSTTTHTTVAVGITPTGEQLTVDLRRNSVVLVTGSGKSAMLARTRYALERQGATVFSAEGIRADSDEVILAADEELRSRLRSRTDDAAPAVLLVDGLQQVIADRDLGHEVVQAIREIAIKGRAAGVHLVLAAQSTWGIPTALRMNLSTRIELAADHGGVLTDSEGETTPFTALL